MPRYFFNTRIGDDTIPDVEGEELRDADHAWEVAKAMIEEILEDQGDHPKPVDGRPRRHRPEG